MNPSPFSPQLDAMLRRQAQASRQHQLERVVAGRWGRWPRVPTQHADTRSHPAFPSTSLRFGSRAPFSATAAYPERSDLTRVAGVPAAGPSTQAVPWGGWAGASTAFDGPAGGVWSGEGPWASLEPSVRETVDVPGASPRLDRDAWWEQFRESDPLDLWPEGDLGVGGEDGWGGPGWWPSLGDGDGLGLPWEWDLGGCKKLPIPPESTWGTECRDELSGVGECGDAIPCWNPVDLGGFWDEVDAVRDDVRGNIAVSGFRDDDIEAFIELAVGLVKRNIDLVHWAACFALGADTKLGKRIENKLDRWGSRRLRVRQSACDGWVATGERFPFKGWGYSHYGGWPGTSAAFGGSFDWVGGVVNVCDGGTFYTQYAIWQKADSTARACGAIDAATAFAHELSHIVWSTPDDDVGGCGEADLFENAFTWALYSRYSFVLESECCGDFVAESTAGTLGVDPTLLAGGVQLVARDAC